MDRDQLKATLEALVFSSDIPLTTNALKEALPGIEWSEIKAALTDLQADYEAQTRGVDLIEVAGGWIFRTKKQFAEVISRLRTSRPMRLSRPALETLSIVAYRQPVTRGGVEDIRGVDSGGVLRTLLEKKLIRILGRSEAVGNPLLYGTTKEFLQVFGLKNLTDLPTLKEFQELDEEAKSKLPPDMHQPEAPGPLGEEGGEYDVEADLADHPEGVEPGTPLDPGAEASAPVDRDAPTVADGNTGEHAAATDPDEDAAIHEPTEAEDEDAATNEKTEFDDDEEAAIHEPTELDDDVSAAPAVDTPLGGNAEPNVP